MTQRTREWVLAALVAVFGATSASAGDIATFHPLGFSVDGGIFVFEQHGTQDGSGFPYSDVFFVDTVKDAYLPGTPIRVRIDDEAAGPSVARRESLKQARPLMEAHSIADQPGNLVALNPVSEVGSDPYRLEYRAYPAEPAFGEVNRLDLEEFDLPVTQGCKDIVESAKGFRLRHGTDGAAAKILHEDESVPDSRRCPTGYRIGGVMTFQPQQGEPVHVAMILVLSFGFEGRDGRWIAVPFRP